MNVRHDNYAEFAWSYELLKTRHHLTTKMIYSQTVAGLWWHTCRSSVSLKRKKCVERPEARKKVTFFLCTKMRSCSIFLEYWGVRLQNSSFHHWGLQRVFEIFCSIVLHELENLGFSVKLCPLLNENSQFFVVFFFSLIPKDFLSVITWDILKVSLCVFNSCMSQYASPYMVYRSTLQITLYKNKTNQSNYFD